MSKLISVIIPVYNVEKYLEKCIDSVLKQTYSNLEIILVDDGSKDNSGKICDEYAEKDNRIKVIHKENGGLSDARNTGIKNSTGDYLSFLDGDDCLKLDFYEYLADLMKNEKYDIAECKFLRIPVEKIENVQEILMQENSLRQIKAIEQTREQALEELYGFYLNPYVNKVVVWNKLYKRELFDNIEFPIGRFHEDEFTTFKVLDKIKYMITSNRLMNAYMQSPNSIMRRNISLKQIKDNLDAYEEASIFFENDITIKVNCVRRYLENCLELYYKVDEKSDEDENLKLEKYDFIKNVFKENFEKNIEFLEKYTINDERKFVIDVLKDAYNSLKENSNVKLSQFYKIIDEKQRIER